MSRQEITIPARADQRFRAGMAAQDQVNVKGLEKHLRRHLEGEVRFDSGSRALYATDAGNYRQEPIGVVVPKTLDDVEATVAACRSYGAPLLSRGCGTSLSGETVNFAVVMDFSKYLDAVRWVRRRDKTAACQPGVICDDLKAAAAEHGLTWGPDPSTHEYCTLGGMMGNNSCGVHSVMAQFYGNGPRTSDNVEELEVLTYDGARFRVGPTSEEELDEIIAAGGRKGEIYAGLRDLRDRYADAIRAGMPAIPRRVSGYNLDELLPERGFNVARALIGTEGTCVTVLDAVVDLVEEPGARATVVAGYEDIFAAAAHTQKVMAHRPLGVEGVDELLFEDLREEHRHLRDIALLPQGQGWLLVEIGGRDRQEAEKRGRDLVRDLEDDPDPPMGVKLCDPSEASRLWQVREAGLGATAFPPDGRDHWPGWEDSAVPPEHIGDYLRDLRALYDAYDLRGAMYGHLAQGCVHSRISFDLRTEDGIANYRRFMEEAADLVASYGGSLSGEHGDGQQRAELLPRMYGEELVDAFREFKRIWDPGWKMNPGKVVDPYRIDEHLRLGADYSPAEPETYFSFSGENGSLSHAALRCVGIGQCRDPHDVKTMCPSFQVLREEKHSTRGRARIFHEMLQGDTVTGGWRDDDVFDAMYLCLSCKGCTSECPTNVDIPTLKAEFLAHYYAKRLRPRSAYAMGWIMYAAKAGSYFPSVANLGGQVPPLSALTKRLGGVAPQREVPTFAKQTFRAWFAGHETPNPSGPPVVLWPDTFNDHFKPETAIACVRVLEDAGFRVQLPERWLCCGRPLYDYGFLGMADRFLRQILDVLRPQIQAGIPIVGVEPSCLAVFRDELPQLRPNDEDAKRLTRLSYQFSEFLVEHAPRWQPPRLHRKALVHAHCHHKNGLGGTAAEQRLLDAMGVDYDMPATGCCGMAGSFGFEAGERYDVSVASGERVLLPATRAADSDTLIITNGFSCKEQIRQHTDRRAIHVAQAITMAMDHGVAGAPGELPERTVPTSAASALRGAAVAGAGAGLAGAVALGLRAVRRSPT